MKAIAVSAVTVVVLTACGGAGAAESTAAVVSPTTESVTTTPAPTTLAVTTPPPPPPTSSHDSGEEAEVAARYEEFSVTANVCAAEGPECDLPAVLGQFADPEAELYQLYENRWRERSENGWTVRDLEKIERSVNSVVVDGDFAVLIGCVADGGVVVDRDGAVVDGDVGHREEETFWDRVDGEWRLTGGTTTQVTDPANSRCEF